MSATTNVRTMFGYGARGFQVPSGTKHYIEGEPLVLFRNEKQNGSDLVTVDFDDIEAVPFWSLLSTHKRRADSRSLLPSLLQEEV